MLTRPAFTGVKGLPGDGDGSPVGGKSYSAILKVETDEGFIGMAGTGGRTAKYLASITRRRLKSFIGADPMMTEKIWHQIWELDRLEEFQVHTLGLLDIACWDIKSQKANLPLYKLLGGYEARVPVYASTVTWGYDG